ANPVYEEQVPLGALNFYYDTGDPAGSDFQLDSGEPSTLSDSKLSTHHQGEVAFGLYSNVAVLDSMGRVAPAIDLDISNLTLVVTQQQIRAELFSIHPNGRITYRPLANFEGSDSFQFKVNDGYLDSNEETVRIKVLRTPLPPPDQTRQMPENGLDHAAVHID